MNAMNIREETTPPNIMKNILLFSLSDSFPHGYCIKLGNRFWLACRAPISTELNFMDAARYGMKGDARPELKLPRIWFQYIDYIVLFFHFPFLHGNANELK